MRSKWNEKEAFALVALLPLLDDYVPWTAWSLQPTAIAAILNVLVARHEPRVIELGGGASTLVFASFLRRRDGSLQTIEADAACADNLRCEIARLRLDTTASVITAPLAGCAAHAGPARWFDDDAIRPVAEGPPVDALVVDGPFLGGADERRARYPALSCFGGRLAAAGVVLLDDVDRPGEQEVLDLWRREREDLVWRVIDGTYAIGQAPGRWWQHP